MTRKPYSNTLTTRCDTCSFLCLLPILTNLAFFAVYEPGLCRRVATSVPLQVTHNTLSPDKWQFESPPAKKRNQGGFHFPQRWDFTKPAKLPKSHIHSALKAVHRKGTSLQHQVSDESWNKHLPKAMLLPISWSTATAAHSGIHRFPACYRFQWVLRTHFCSQGWRQQVPGHGRRGKGAQKGQSSVLVGG